MGFTVAVIYVDSSGSTVRPPTIQGFEFCGLRLEG